MPTSGFAPSSGFASRSGVAPSSGFLRELPSIFLTNGISEAHLWLGADAVESGGNLSSWVSRSYLASDVSVGIVGTPTVGVNLQGRRYVEFSGVGQYLTAHSLASIASGTNEPWMLVASLEWLSAGTTPDLVAWSQSNDLVQFHQIGLNSGRWRFHRRDDAGAFSDQGADSVSPSINTLTTLIVVYDGTGWRQYSNLTGFGRNRFVATTGVMNVDQFTIGARLSNNNPTNHGNFRLYGLLLAKVPSGYELSRKDRLKTHGFFTPEIDPPPKSIKINADAKVIAFTGQSNGIGTVANSRSSVPAVALRYWFISTEQRELSAVAVRDNDAHGAEFGFANAAVANNTSLVIVKVAVGGSALADKSGTPLAWLPSISGELFDRGTNYITESLAEISTITRGLHQLTLFWWQGEKDAEDPVDAAAYEANLTALVSAFGSSLSPVLIIIVLLHKDSVKTHASTVRAAQEAVGAANPSTVHLLSPDHLTMELDNIHYPPASHDSVGELGFDADNFQDIAEWHGAAMLDIPSGEWEAYRGGPNRLAEATNGPTAGTLNLVKAATFDGTNQRLTLSFSDYSDPSGTGISVSLFLVIKWNAVVNNRTIISFGDTSGSGLLEFKVSSGDLALNHRDDSSVLTLRGTGWAAETTTHHLIVLNLTPNPAQSRHDVLIRVDGVDQSPPTPEIPLEPTTLTSFGLATRVGATQFASATIGHVRLGSSLSLAELQKREALIAPQWGIVLP